MITFKISTRDDNTEILLLVSERLLLLLATVMAASISPFYPREHMLNCLGQMKTRLIKVKINNGFHCKFQNSCLALILYMFRPHLTSCLMH